MLDKTSSIICAFGLAAAAHRSPYRHLELCGIALGLLLFGNARRTIKHPVGRDAFIAPGRNINFVMCKQITCRGRHPSARMDIYVMAYKTRFRNGQDRSLQSILLCAINNKTIRRAGCPHPAAKKPCLLRQMPQIICRGRCLHRPTEPCRTANFCTKIPDSKPIPRKTKGMRTLASTENPHAYFLGCI